MRAVGPWWLERQLDPDSPDFEPGADAVNVTHRDWVQLGTVSTVERGVVDPRGLVSPGPESWSLDWWIGADDRWHVPSREVGVRQQRIDGAPVIETLMRVPGGDAVHRAYAAQSASGPVVVVEIENRTSIPFAVALAIVPYDPAARGAVGTVALEGVSVSVDGAVSLVFPKPPARVAGDCGGRILDVVTTGEAEAPDAELVVACDDGQAAAAFVFPLPHTAVLRVVLPMQSDADSVSPPTALPAAADVVRGWQVQVERGPRVDVPDDRFRRALDAARSDLLLFPTGEDIVVWPSQVVPWTVTASTVEALDMFGFHIEAEELLAAVPDEQRLDGGIISADGASSTNGAVLWALARHWELSRDDTLVDRLIGPIAKAGHWIDKRRRARRRSLVRDGTPADVVWSWRGLAAMAPVLSRCGQPEVGEDFQSFADRLAADAARAGIAVGDTPVTLERIVALLDRATPITTWPEVDHPTSGGGAAGRGHDPAATAAFCADLRTMLVREQPNGLALCTVVPDTWLGQSWEAQGLPTAAGRLGFAVRWHGDRPALLWELEPHPDVERVEITAPGLDPTWSSMDLEGEALLAPVAPPDHSADPAGGSGASSSFA